MNDSIIIAGGGIAGMFTALLLRQRYPDKPITIIEKSAHAGGLYTSIDYGENGYFDYGMHILYDTGITEIDTLIHGLLPQDEWHVLEGNRKDIAGIFWNGNLQHHSPYIDLRCLPADEHHACLEGLYAAAVQGADVNDHDAACYLQKRFGAPVAAHLSRVIEKLYGMPASEVSSLATCQPAMNRVLLLDADRMDMVMPSEGLRARIGYPDQLHMPPLRTNHQRGWYPRRFGMIHVINALYGRLIRDNVSFLFNSRINGITVKGHKVDSLSLDHAGQMLTLDSIDRFFWIAGWAGLAKLLGIPFVPQQFSAKAAHIHLRFDRPLEMGELYHFYCYDSGYQTFRVTNFSNYCPGAKNAAGYPACIEYWPEINKKPEDYIHNGLKELAALGIIGNRHKLNFSAVQMVPNHHQLFRLRSVQGIKAARAKIRDMGISNLSIIGVMAEDGELLLYEILRHAYEKL